MLSRGAGGGALSKATMALLCQKLEFSFSPPQPYEAGVVSDSERMAWAVCMAYPHVDKFFLYDLFLP